MKYTPKRIVSYADRSWSRGDVYIQNEFIEIHKTKPDYKYVIKNKRSHKSKFRKSNGVSESILMKSKTIFRIWDCGKIKFEFKL